MKHMDKLLKEQEGIWKVGFGIFVIEKTILQVLIIFSVMLKRYGL